MSLFDPTGIARSSESVRYLASVNSKGAHRDHAFESAFLLGIAYSVVADLERLAPPEPPERPLSFPMHDDDLHDALRRAARARTKNSDDRMLLNEHGSWRFACWNTEIEGSNRLLELFTSARALEQHLLRGGNDQRAHDAWVAIVDFVHTRWDYEMRGETPPFFEARRLADELSRMDRVARILARPRASREESEDE